MVQYIISHLCSIILSLREFYIIKHSLSCTSKEIPVLYQSLTAQLSQYWKNSVIFDHFFFLNTTKQRISKGTSQDRKWLKSRTIFLQTAAKTLEVSKTTFTDCSFLIGILFLHFKVKKQLNESVANGLRLGRSV